MPVKNNYRHYDLDEPTKKTFVVNQFRGVDYTPGQLNVDDLHAVEISNIVYKDKVNQKRNGWEQIAKVGAYEYYLEDAHGNLEKKINTTNINGVWVFKMNNKEYVIAHIGRLLFEVEGIGRNQSFLNVKLTPIVYSRTKDQIHYTNVVSIELNDAKSSAFFGHKRIYILDGNNYIVLKLEKDNEHKIAFVEDDEETYIPTTTVGITYIDSPIKANTPLDDVNMMTQWRKNKLISGTYVDDGTTLRRTEFWRYELDTNVNAKNPTDINNIEITVDYLKEVE